MISKKSLLTFCLLSTLGALPARASPDYHLVGWMNAFLPGTGQVLLGNPWRGAGQAVYEIGTTALGISLSNSGNFSLDGFASEPPKFVHRDARKRITPWTYNMEREFYGDILQEFGIKAHMVNTFEAYREAAAGHDPWIDDTSTWGLFKEPFNEKNLTNPWVYVPMAAVLVATVGDYFVSRNSGIPRTDRLTPYSNFLYAFNYGVWQPFGSGAPEEMFYRGFVQNEALHLIDSPWFAIPVSTAAFAFSHNSDGRIGAAISGLYLGYLADKYQGRLGPGITLHFWAVVMLGVETILLNHEAQHDTPPTGLYVQLTY